MTAILTVLTLLLTFLIVLTRLMWRAAERAVLPVGKFCKVQGGHIHYVAKGPENAPVLVLIHGLSGQLQHFTYAMVDELARDHRVIALDRPGCGYSRRTHDGLADLQEQGRMIWECLDQLEATSPVLVGHSLGGALSLSMAQARPGAVKALALISPATQPMEEAPEAFKGLQVRSPVTRRVIGHLLAVPLAKLTTKLVLDKVFSPEPWPDDFMLRAGAVLGYRPVAFVTASADLVMMETAMPVLKAGYDTHPMPSGGILYGEEDEILPAVLNGPPMEEYGLPCEILPGRGHMLPITAPKECCAFARRIAGAVE